MNNNYSILLIITNVCNLNCFECSATCSIKQRDQWFITKQDFIKNLIKIKNIFSDIDTIDISGGETLIHPDFLSLCKIARTILPDKKINFWTNGVLLNKFSQKELTLLFNKYDINFQISLYPSTINTIANFENQYKHFQNNFLILSRFFFYKNIYNFNGETNINENFNSCFHFKNPIQLYMYKNRIYNCCSAPHMMETLNCHEDINQFSIHIDDEKLIDKDYVFQFFNKPLNICKYCVKENYREENVPWNQAFQLNNDYFTTLEENYLFDFNKYKQIYYNKIHNDQLIASLKNEYFLNKIKQDASYNKNIMYHYNNRFFGKKDIIILFNNNIISNNKINLIKQLINNLNNINLYFISCGNNNYTNEKYLYDIFFPFSHETASFWFYKINKKEELINFIQKHSYGQNKRIIKL